MLSRFLQIILLFCLAPFALADQRPVLSLVIDDLGYSFENGQAAINLGIALFSSGDSDSALAMFERATTIESAAPDAHYNLGIAHTKLGDIARAVRHYEQAIELRPGYAQPINELISHYLSIVIPHPEQTRSGGHICHKKVQSRWNPASRFLATKATRY